VVVAVVGVSSPTTPNKRENCQGKGLTTTTTTATNTTTTYYYYHHLPEEHLEGDVRDGLPHPGQTIPWAFTKETHGNIEGGTTL